MTEKPKVEVHCPLCGTLSSIEDFESSNDGDITIFTKCPNEKCDAWQTNIILTDAMLLEDKGWKFRNAEA